MNDKNETIRISSQQFGEKVKTVDGYQRATGGFQPTMEGHQSVERGYKPALPNGQNQSTPPQGGSGVPPKSQTVSNTSEPQPGSKK